MITKIRILLMEKEKNIFFLKNVCEKEKNCIFAAEKWQSGRSRRS